MLKVYKLKKSYPPRRIKLKLFFYYFSMNITSYQLRRCFIDFFAKKHGHVEMPSASLLPENDPTVLFTTAGMHPLVPYLLGEKHPAGRRLTNCQKCLRTDDIDEVGDNTHLTFFEMLGNWSLGDASSVDGVGEGSYFKKMAIEMSYEFLTKELGLNQDRLAVSVFAGDADAPFDAESYEIWQSLGLPKERIAKLPKKNNWWGPAGATGPCGPDTEMFYWSSKDPSPKNFNSEDPHWVEIWNDVFMQYNKTAEGKFEPLAQKNVDTGMGLERVTVILQNKTTIFETDLFTPIMEKIESLMKNVKHEA